MKVFNVEITKKGWGKAPYTITAQFVGVDMTKEKVIASLEAEKAKGWSMGFKLIDWGEVVEA